MENDLRAMCQENLDLSKELAKSLQEGFFVIEDSFESALKQVRYFYPDVHISQDRVHISQAIEDGKMVSLMD